MRVRVVIILIVLQPKNFLFLNSLIGVPYDLYKEAIFIAETVFQSFS